MTPKEADLLLDELIEGTITEADHIRIEAELTVSGELRAEYYRRIQLQELLTRVARERGDRQPTAPKPSLASTAASRPLRQRMLRTASVVLASSAATLAIMFCWNGLPWKGPVPTRGLPQTELGAAEPTAEGFATLRGQRDATWQGVSIRTGQLVPGLPLHLLTGQAHLELFSGVQLVVAGDAVFTIDSPMQVTVERGRFRCQVPEPAQGFCLKTPGGEILDLGTEFHVAVNSDGADVEVLNGLVELHPSRDDVRRIQSQESMRLQAEGTLAATEAQLNRLPGPAEFADQTQSQQQQSFERWQATLADLQVDPRLVALYQFSPSKENDRVLRNLAQPSSRRASDGAIVVGEPTSDRWGRPGAAVDFSRLGSRIRLNAAGEHHGLTMMCWVKIDSLEHLYNSLLLTDGHEDREPHWQLMNDGRIFFSVKIPPANHSQTESATAGRIQQREFYSPVIWDPSMSGRWMMLAIRYDVHQQSVTHFVNGQVASTERIPDDALVSKIRIGAASIGNWSQPMYRTDPEFVLRNLNGSMDEFAIFSGSLTDDEILKLYQAGAIDGT